MHLSLGSSEISNIHFAAEVAVLARWAVAAGVANDKLERHN